MKQFAVDLSWVRPGITGGTESYIRSLLTGIGELGRPDCRAVLILAADNYGSFEEYKKYSCFKLLKCRVKSSSPWKRVLWQNVKMGRMLNRLGISACLEPVYGKPFLGTGDIDFYTVVHDLQALHFPAYFSRKRVLWMKMSWKNAVCTSRKVIVISDFVRKDILKHYRTDTKKVTVIYNSVPVNQKKHVDECSKAAVLKKHALREKEFYYTVSSLLPHKNLKTLILALKKLKQSPDAFLPLVISGVGGKSETELHKIIKDSGLETYIIFTEFIPDEERNILYRCCKAFLFPSIFEGFGLPPVEAMSFGVPVLTTRCASIKEISGGLLNYVDSPLNSSEWAERLDRGLELPDSHEVEKLLKRYEPVRIAEKYVNLLCEGMGENTAQ